MAELIITADEFKKSWTSVKVAVGEIKITGYKGTETNIVVPSRVGENVVVELDNFLFSPEKPRLKRIIRPFFKNEIKSVEIPDCVRKMGECTFAGCIGLEKVVLPTAMDGIEAATFRDCKNLKEVNLPEGISYIEDYAFSGCKSLPAFEFPQTLTYLGRQAIAFNPNFERIFISANIKTIELKKAGFPGEEQASAFLFLDNVKEIKVAEDNANYCDIDGVLYTKDKTELLYCPSKKEGGLFTVPEGVEIIGENAFGGCMNLTEIILPSTLKVIRDGAFSEFTGSDQFGSLYYGPTQGCGIINIIIPEGVTEIPDYAFKGCANLTKISFPSTLKRIGRGALGYCVDAINNINLPEGLEEIAERALKGCNCEELRLPDSITKVGSYAFGSTLQKVNVPKSMTSVSIKMFGGCSDLKTVELHDGIKSIDELAFFQCHSLKEMVLPESVEEIGGGAFMHSGISSIKFSNNLKTIRSKAFHGCIFLESIDLPESLEYVGEGAFEECRIWGNHEGVYSANLKKVTIRGNNTELDKEVFKGCTTLTDFFIYGESINIKNIGWGIRGGWPDFSYSDTLFHVKEGSAVEKFVKSKGFRVEYIQ